AHRRLPSPRRLRAPLADARLLADLLAKVVELGAVDIADGGDVDLLDLRRVEREGPLDAHAERLLPDGGGLARAGALPADDDALEDGSAAALSLDDREVDAHGVPRLERRQIVTQLTLLECLDDAIHQQEGARPGGQS